MRGKYRDRILTAALQFKDGTRTEASFVAVVDDVLDVINEEIRRAWTRTRDPRSNITHGSSGD